MKRIITIISTVVLFIGASQIATGQINRTLETKVADILAQLPTKDLNHSNRLMEEVISLDIEGILKFTDMLVPLGTGDDTKARYAIQSVAVYGGAHQNANSNNVVEQALLKALNKASDNEVKTFLMERLIVCGTNESIPQLSKYLSDKNLHKPALATLRAVGTDEAAQTVLEATKTADNVYKPAFIEVLGQLQYAPAKSLLYELGKSATKDIQQRAIMALAEIGSVDTMGYLISAARASNYKLDDSKAILALIHYGNKLAESGKTDLSLEIGTLLLKNCTAEDQLHFRSAGIYLINDFKNKEATKTLLKEIKKGDVAYKAVVLDAASENLSAENVIKWVKAYKKASDEVKPLIVNMLSKSDDAVVFEKCLVPAIQSSNEAVKVAGIKELAYQKKEKALPALLKSLKIAASDAEYKALEATLLRVVSIEDSAVLANTLTSSNSKAKQVLVNVLALRNANDQFDTIVGLLNGADNDLKQTIYAAMPLMASSDNLSDLIALLPEATEDVNISNIQKGIISILKTNEGVDSELIYRAYQNASEQSKWVPLLSALGSNKALTLVSDQLKTGSAKAKDLALQTLSDWQNNDALPVLFQTVKNGDASLQANAFNNYLKKVGKSGVPEDQKLLLVRKLMPYANTKDQKKKIIQAAGNIKTFLSLIFVSEFLDEKELLTTASNAVIKIALPTPGKNNGLSGTLVRNIVSKSVDNLTGPDSQYIKIDVKEFLENMPKEEGFVSIFNGKDLSGWEGLVKNPIARQKMSKKALEKAQSAANEQMLRDWFVKDGVIGFKGEGYNNICTIKDYGDFEMLVDWKITNGGDSGIYLRGTPQVQIWDIARTNVGAQVGSGGLYNNQKHESKPLVVADNPVDEWNTFRIKMIGDRVTVYLNGVLVTDNVPLENYWDRSQKIFPKEAIELQAHGEDLGFRNVYVREIVSGDNLLTKEERQEGFKSLFNGKDLDHWIGNKVDYVVDNNEIAVRPKQGGHGNLFTAQEYSDFIFRFEFKLTPGANNGLGIHAPLKGDAAYVGKELQILDNTASIYANLKPYQYHGSVYGIIAAKRGFLKPVGEWNYEEVQVKGDHIKITLNGTVIVDGNIKEATKNGTADHKDHPGLKRTKGHIGFLGHGSELWFRNIRIKDLAK
ncbi:DUF1080 domain-containing protein [Snuella sedimenti]|uniref:DUF1080 domain-containing protein n=1 Tax=Snuella sedimenti TaxID=2798802 RepID=A0A8J7IRF8_9FLAO|nr:DUF1080 domain-containing protein [Snuella sedimenti]MBJ6369777.1 DUF1080 domain-containing protein [Snuella sedimenti]